MRRERFIASRARSVRRRALRGFSLVEMLAALLVLSLMTGLVATGVSSGMRVYQSEQFVSQAEVLEGTIENALSDPFRFMKAESGSQYTIKYEGNDITFEGAAGPIESTGGRLYLKGTSSSPVKLLNEGIYGNCKVSATKVQCDSDLVKYSFTIANATDTSMKREFEFTVLPLGDVSQSGFSTSGRGVSVDGDNAGTVVTTVDKNSLNNEILMAGRDLSNLDRTDAQRATLRNAIAAAQAVYDNASATQTQVNQATSQLRAARLAFLRAGSIPYLDTFPIEEQLNAADLAKPWIDKDDASLKANLETAYNEATEALTTSMTQADIASAASKLRNALRAYNEGVTTAALAAEVATCKELEYDPGRQELWDALQQQLETAEGVLSAARQSPPSASQAEIDAACGALASARSNYSLGDQRTALGAALEEADRRCAEQNWWGEWWRINTYWSLAWEYSSVFQGMIDNARSVYNNQGSSANECRAARMDVQKVTRMCVLANYSNRGYAISSLQNAIAAAERIQRGTKAGSAWLTFQEAIQRAWEVSEAGSSASAEQAAIDALNNAITTFENAADDPLFPHSGVELTSEESGYSTQLSGCSWKAYTDKDGVEYAAAQNGESVGLVYYKGSYYALHRADWGNGYATAKLGSAFSVDDLTKGESARLSYEGGDQFYWEKK